MNWNGKLNHFKPWLLKLPYIYIRSVSLLQRFIWYRHFKICLEGFYFGFIKPFCEKLYFFQQLIVLYFIFCFSSLFVLYTNVFDFIMGYIKGKCFLCSNLFIVQSVNNCCILFCVLVYIWVVCANVKRCTDRETDSQKDIAWRYWLSLSGLVLNGILFVHKGFLLYNS